MRYQIGARHVAEPVNVQKKCEYGPAKLQARRDSPGQGPIQTMARRPVSARPRVSACRTVRASHSHVDTSFIPQRRPESTRRRPHRARSRCMSPCVPRPGLDRGRPRLAPRIFQESFNVSLRRCYHIDTKENEMFRIHELTHLSTPTPAATTPQLPSAALAGAAWTQTSDDPFFAEISPTAMGYRSAPKGFADSGARRGERRKRMKAFPTLSMHARGRAHFRFGVGGRHFVGA
jgi:hypothetical protein